jgi:hypothetical protein
MLDLDAITARAEAATPGPWTKFPEGPTPPVVAMLNQPPGPLYVCTERGVEPSDLAEPDADFIAHARADVPALVSELRAAREVVEAAAGFSAFMNEDAEDLQWPDEQLADLAASLAAYRAVVGPE